MKMKIEGLNTNYICFMPYSMSLESDQQGKRALIISN